MHLRAFEEQRALDGHAVGDDGTTGRPRFGSFNYRAPEGEITADLRVDQPQIAPAHKRSPRLARAQEKRAVEFEPVSVEAGQPASRQNERVEMRVPHVDRICEPAILELQDALGVGIFEVELARDPRALKVDTLFVHRMMFVAAQDQEADQRGVDRDVAIGAIRPRRAEAAWFAARGAVEQQRMAGIIGADIAVSAAARDGRTAGHKPSTCGIV
ncbi:MAG: hypothetical protein WA940_08745 [Sphingopyxis sp.]